MRFAHFFRSIQAKYAVRPSGEPCPAEDNLRPGPVYDLGAVPDNSARTSVSGGDAVSFDELECVLPPPPARVLAVGVDRLLLAPRLESKGYRVCDLADADAVTLREGVSADEPTTADAAGDATGGRLDVLVLADNPLGLDSLELFNRARESLAAEGKLILSEALLQRLFERSMRGPENVAEYLGNVAARYGFRFAPVPAEGAWRCFVKARKPRWRLSHATERDVPKLLALFRGSFGHEMSRELWLWKYGKGRGHGVVAWRGGAPVAYYGGTIREVMFFGRPLRVLLIGDVMVDTRERAVMTKTGAFFMTGATFAEVHGATYSTAFGFPSERHMRVAERTGLYTAVGRMVEIRWPIAPDRPRLSTRVRHIPAEFPARDRGMIDRLWGEMREDLRDAIVCARDAGYVEQRYFRHPQHRYELLLVTGRLTGKPLGVVVLRRHDATCELSDVIGPLANIPPLIMQARRFAGRMGADGLYTWITRQHAARFAATGGSEKPLDAWIPSCTWIDVPLIEAQRDRWWLMSGDTDYR